MSEFLVEIFSEEIPARMQKQASEDFEKLICESLKKEGIDFKTVEHNVTPRRLVLFLDGLPKKLEQLIEERKGPSVNANEKAVEGFAKSCGLEIKDLFKRETPKGEFFFANVKKDLKDIKEVLKDSVLNALKSFPWPKSMRWADNHERWVRPINNILCIFDKKVIDLEFAKIKSNDLTFGHRFLAPKAIKVSDYSGYKKALQKAYVVLNREERKKIILENALKTASSNDLRLKEDEGLLEEVTGLVEYPVVYMGMVDSKFMELPEEILITSLRNHQKYFCVATKSGKLAPHFIFVSNMITKDNGKQIIAGNERVLRARLSDALFFWEQDKKTPLISRVAKLKERVFHAKLGSMHEKIERMITLAVYMARELKKSEPALVDRAVLLSKADLSTGMVGEFPELQGVMGRYYAIQNGEDERVADAIKDHYSPLGPSDSCPSSQTSIITALSDKIDTLVGFWLIDQKPTSSKDPFALRRSALGVIRIIIENKINLNLKDMIKKSSETFNIKGNIVDDLLSFIEDRMKIYLKDKGISHDYVNAVVSLKNDSDLTKSIEKVNTLNSFLKTDDGANLLSAYKRAFNILRIEEAKDKCTYNCEVDKSLLVQIEESNLFEAVTKTNSKVTESLKNKDYEVAMNALAFIRKPLDDFFDKVTVNCSHAPSRTNRLNILKIITKMMENIANFAIIEN